MVYFRPALDGRMEGDGNSKLMIYNLERAIRLMPRNSWQYTIVIDCEGMYRLKILCSCTVCALAASRMCNYFSFPGVLFPALRVLLMYEPVCLTFRLVWSASETAEPLPPPPS